MHAKEGRMQHEQQQFKKHVVSWPKLAQQQQLLAFTLPNNNNNNKIITLY